MKGACLILLMLYGQVAFAQPGPETAFRRLLPAYLQGMANALHRISMESDSAQRTQAAAGILRDYFTSDTVLIPDLTAPQIKYTQEHPSIPVGKLLQRLPDLYWSGFQMNMDTAAFEIQAIQTEDSSLRAEILVPISWGGIQLPQRKTQRVGEKVKITLLGRWNNDSVSAIKIISMEGTGQWLFGQPLTIEEVHLIENQLRETVRILLDPSLPNTLRTAARQRLNKNWGSDTIFWVRHDKVLVTVGINECTLPDSLGSLNPETVTIEAYSLEHLTDFQKGANQVYIGQRTWLENITPPITEQKWQQSSITRLVPIAHEVAENQLQTWKISNLIIHL